MESDKHDVTFTKGKVQGLRRAYEQAVANDASFFVFAGEDYVTGYAKYLLQYLEPKFGISTRE